MIILDYEDADEISKALEEIHHSIISDYKKTNMLM